jgi:hypothetical protein
MVELMKIMKPTTRLYALACAKCGHILTHYISDRREGPMKKYQANDRVDGQWAAKAHDVEFHEDDGEWLRVRVVTLLPIRRKVRKARGPGRPQRPRTHIEEIADERRRKKAA